MTSQPPVAPLAAMPPLPIDAVLPEIGTAIRARGMAVVQAPPGAGKTTGVPLYLRAERLIQGRIVMLEPRRLAARAAATRMAEMLGEKVGATVGYRIRGEAAIGPATRIEIVTEGILTRMIQSDASLPGIGAVIFDEFHERSLAADLGLALVLEVRAALRPDLVVIVMSATLDAAPVAALMGDAPMVTADARAWPVTTRWLPRPLVAVDRIEDAATRLVLQAAEEEEKGGILVFLPGEAEIRRVEAGLRDRLPQGFAVRPLFGAMTLGAQAAALGPVEGRRVVLATSIAETSLTIPDVRVVVDAGRARRARFDPATGMSRLVTERVTKAEAAQRQGRAGRVAPGVCYRMWTKGEEGALAAFPPAEIEVADLAPLALELALWGSDDLPFLTRPNPGRLAEARALLTDLGALADAGRITAHGRRLAALPLHPRLAHMLALAGPRAAPLAATLAERDPLRGEAPDLALRLDLVAARRVAGAVHHSTLDRIRAEAARLARATPPPDPAPDLSLGQMAALAYPDRIGLRRSGEAPLWVLSGGRGAMMGAGGPLSGARLIVATDLEDTGRDARIRQAVALTEAELRAVPGLRPRWHEVCEWSRREGRVIARRQERLGALVLADRPWDAPPEMLARAALDGLRGIGLPLPPAARRLCARVELARGGRADFPDFGEAALLDTGEDWLLPALASCRTEADLRALDWSELLRHRLDRAQTATLDRIAPSEFVTPMNRRVPVDYGAEHPAVTVRLQEMFGLTTHPVVGARHLPLLLTLLDPGQHPVQVTRDLPGFWATSYADVRRDLRGRYPRHPWPEDPAKAPPTLRAKPRDT